VGSFGEGSNQFVGTLARELRDARGPFSSREGPHSLVPCEWHFIRDPPTTGVYSRAPIRSSQLASESNRCAVEDSSNG
jgi:hypothetical protein